MNENKLKHHRNSEPKTGNRDQIRTTALKIKHAKALPILIDISYVHMTIYCKIDYVDILTFYA